MKLTIKNNQLIEDLIGTSKTEFPKYTTQIINLANQNAQGTRPKMVGQLSELIQLCPGNKYNDWEKWYLEKYPTKIDDATEKVYDMLLKLKNAINLIDKKMVKEWVEDLILIKTFIGLKNQESILKRIAKIKRTSYKLAESYDESKNIDGYIGNKPVSIKPITYKTKNMLRENINVNIIYYKKTKTGITVEYSDDL